MQEARGASPGEPMSIISITVAKRCFNSWHNHIISKLTELVTWAQVAIQNHIVDGGKIENMHVMQLSMKPQMITSRYAKVRAYNNHYKVTTNNEATTMATNDSRVASILQ
jgi:hypothetical protein